MARHELRGWHVHGVLLLCQLGWRNRASPPISGAITTLLTAGEGGRAGPDPDAQPVVLIRPPAYRQARARAPLAGYFRPARVYR